VVGALVMKFKFEKSGVEMIPNYKFWKDLPFLIKDGFLFIYHSIAGLFGKRSEKTTTYDTL
jgi:hypothetical protein